MAKVHKYFKCTNIFYSFGIIFLLFQNGWIQNVTIILLKQIYSLYFYPVHYYELKFLKD